MRSDVIVDNYLYFIRNVENGKFLVRGQYKKDRWDEIKIASTWRSKERAMVYVTDECELCAIDLAKAVMEPIHE